MQQMKINKDNDDWGFYIDIEDVNSHNSLNSYLKKEIPDVIIPDSSYCIDIYDFGENSDYYDNYNDEYNDCNLYDSVYDSVYDFLEYYKNKCNTKKVTNMLIKVSSTTFATIALSYVLLVIL